MKVQNQTTIRAYQSSGFIGKYQQLIKDVVIPYQYSVLCDEAPDTEKSHVVQNFINAGKAVRGEDVGDGFYGMVFQDSDAAKWIEAAAYSLSLFPDTELEKTVDSLIDIIADAQDTDGYLNTYYTIKDKDKRWTNLLEGHELYCSGHMMEAACRTLWESITRRRMYLTGGIGSTVLGEAFSVDYDLPNDTAYAETCASIGLMFFASRMLENDPDGEYADVAERAFYNTVLAGMQLDGKRFFYVNPLEIIPGISGVAQTHRHDLPMRPKWYTCACCPPNVARLISSFGKYAYGENESTAFCHLFAAGEISLTNGMQFTCETDYPYDFTITYRIKKGRKLAIRIPAFSKSYKIMQNNKELSVTTKKGYLYLDVADDDCIELTLDGTPHFQYASSKVPELTSKTAISRGPLVYCFEGADNDEDVLSLSLKRGGTLSVSSYKKELLEGTVTITADAFRTENIDSLYTDKAPEAKPCKAVAIPYYTWGNRHENQMRVWMNEIN